MNARSAAGLDSVWRTLVALVMDSRGEWRRNSAEATGLPFSRIRALHRIADGPLTLTELADAMTCDAPAATVAVNDLEKRGLVERQSHPADRRVKLVSLTPAGRRAMNALLEVPDPVPQALTDLPAGDIAELVRILKPLGRKRR